MPFWGASQQQKDAQAFFPTQGKWNTEQYKNWLEKGNTQFGQGQGWQQWGTGKLQDAATHGYGTPQDIRGYGETIMPGVAEAKANRWGRINNTADDWSGTFGGMQDRWNQYGDTINSAYGGANQWTDSTHGDVVGNIRDTLDSTRGENRDTSGRLIGQAAETYGNIRGDIGGAYDSARKDLEGLAPAGDAAAARAARAFAPQMADAQRRARMAGVDPNSVEAQTLTGRVAAQKGRAMDDAFADSARDYVDRSTGLTLNRANQLANVDREALNTSQGLQTRQSDIDRNLSLYGGEQFRGAVDRYGQRKAGLDLDYANARGAFTQGANNLDTQGFNTRHGLAQEANQEELTGLNLDQAQFGAGMDFVRANEDFKNRNAGAVAGVGGTAIGQGMNAAGTARGFGNDAAQNWNTTYQLESPNAGWGKKLLAGVGGAALNFAAPGLNKVMPGLGTFASGVGGSMLGGGGGGGGMMPYGAGGGGGWNPYPYINYDYYGPGQTTSSGDYRVGRR